MTQLISAYREHRPCAALRPYVQCFWTRVSGGIQSSAPNVHRVLPDGCIDIVFNFGEPWVEGSGCDHHLHPGRSYVVGTMTRSLLVERVHRTQFLGVRFQPGKARAFLDLFAAKVTDQNTGLENIWGNEARRLEERLAELPSTQGRISLLESELRRRLQPRAVEDARVNSAVDLILRSQGSIPVEEVSTSVGITRQHLARRFEEHVGIRPKLFARVIRFKSLVERASCPRPVEWATAALELGYYDQAHMIADFREFTGFTPAAFDPQF
ncbi:MAG: helix-turn-helix domain-containing protein [Acidobacteriia bacterium]|nr:helix-turn-helix domain-containing protein [Terriglobia bacterium]